jgi:type IV pilus assembly protein PilB
MAQRLTLQLCPESGDPVPIEGSIKMMVDKEFADLPPKYLKEIDFTDKVYKTSSTPDCPNGTRGRVAVMEVMEMDSDLESVILKGGNELEIAKIARSKGMLTMKEDAIVKAMHRMIPFEEVNML